MRLSLRRAPSLPTVLALLALLALTSGCGDSPTGPRPPDPTVLYPGVVATGRVQSLRDTVRYVLDLHDVAGAAIYFTVPGEMMRLEIFDASGRRLAMAFDEHHVGSPQRFLPRFLPPSPDRYRVEVSSVSSDAPGGYTIRVIAGSSAPEHVPAVMTVGSVVSGEDLHHRWDVDTFAVTAVRTQLVALYVRRTKPGAGGVAVRAWNPESYPPEFIGAGPADTLLGSVSTSPFTLVAGSHWTFTVGYGEIAPDSGSTGYELLLKPVNVAPESVPATLTPGDTVRESIDYASDIDQFTLSGTPGARYNVFSDAPGAPPHAVSVVVDGPTFGPVGVGALAGGHALADNATGVFIMPPGGTVTVTVREYTSIAGTTTGAYRLLVYPIDSRPEGTSATLALDQPTTSRLEMLGDVDTYTLTIPRDTIVNIMVRGAGTTGRPLGFTLLGPRDSAIGGRTLGQEYAGVVGDSAGVGAFLFRAGSYSLRVAGGSTYGVGYVGDYRILPRAVNTATESRSATITVGDSVHGERLDFPGDVDRFHVSLTAGDSVYLKLLAAAPNQVPVVLGLFESATDSATRPIGDIFTIVRSGDYYVDVRGATRGIDLTETGDYAFRIGRITGAPEDRAAELALGDTVRSAIDVRGDADDFLLLASAGTTVSGTMQWGGAERPNVWVELRDPATGTMLDSSHINHETMGHAVVPASGTLRVRVHELYGPCNAYGCSGPFGSGPYSFVLRTIDRAPETRSASYTLGDTVSGESILPAADIDEYAFSATAGDTVDVFFQTPMGTWGWGGLKITLIDLSTGTSLGSVSSTNPTDRLEDIVIPRVVLPSTGVYQIRVEGHDSREGKGAYRFRVAR